jgi:hypothetical protein
MYDEKHAELKSYTLNACLLKNARTWGEVLQITTGGEMLN